MSIENYPCAPAPNSSLDQHLSQPMSATLRRIFNSFLAHTLSILKRIFRHKLMHYKQRFFPIILLMLVTIFAKNYPSCTPRHYLSSSTITIFTEVNQIFHFSSCLKIHCFFIYNNRFAPLFFENTMNQTTIFRKNDGPIRPIIL